MTEETSSPYEVSQSGMSAPPQPDQAAVIPTSIPKVFGIIHIVYSVLGMLTALAGIAGIIFMKTMMSKLGENEKELEVFNEAFDQLIIYSYLDIALKIVLGLILLAAGIGLLKRKLWAQKASVFWAVARMVIAIVMVAITMGPTREFQEKVNESANADQAQIQEMAQGVGSVVGIIFICIYPVLCLIFLSRKNVKDSLS